MNLDLKSIIEERWRDWKVVRELDHGGFGRVFEIRHETLIGETRAAVKVIVVPPDEAEINRLRREGHSEQEINTHLHESVFDIGQEIGLMDQVKGHSNIVNIDYHDVIGMPEVPCYIVLIRMELLTPLTDRVEDMTEADVIRLGVDLCRALELCHGKNIVHRDIKPENIFVSANGDFKLGDFGVSRVLENTTWGFTPTGTPDCMPPEVFNNQARHTDMQMAARMDIYSLGMTLYLLLNHMRAPLLPTTGAISNPQRNEARLLRMSGHPLPPPTNASPELANVVLKACAYNPYDRYASAREFQRALLETTEEARRRREEEERKKREEEIRKRRRRRAWLLVVCAIAVAVGCVYLLQRIQTNLTDWPTANPTVTTSPTPTPTVTPAPLTNSANVDGANSASDYVYSPASGLYYHGRNDCSNIDQGVSVSRVPKEVAENSRKQTACPICILDTQQSDASIYLKFVNASTNDNSGIKVYYTENEKYYHVKSDCSGMTGTIRVSLKEALLAGKLACTTCCSAGNTSVYCTSNDAYFHLDKTCQNLYGATEVTLAEALVLGKHRCPIC